MFKSKKEFIEALVSGRKFYSQFGEIIYFNENKLNPFRYIYNNNNYDFCDFNTYGKVTEIKEWYDNIPENGILCWVNDKSYIAIMTYYDKEEHMFYGKVSGSRYNYKDVLPLTNEEIQEFLIN